MISESRKGTRECKACEYDKINYVCVSMTHETHYYV